MTKTTGTTYKILAMGVKLTTLVSSCNIDLCLIQESDDLNIVGCIKQLNACNGAPGNTATTMTLLRAPSDLIALSVTNGRIGLRGSERAKV
jgi:hypothetical protein